MTDPASNESILKRLSDLERRLDVLWARLERIEKARVPPPAAKPAEARPVPTARPSPPLPPVHEAPERVPSPPRPVERVVPSSEAEPTPTAIPAVRESARTLEGEGISRQREAVRPGRASATQPYVGLPKFDWRDVLKKLNLLPPSDEEDFEIHVGTWWATRIGVLFAVICGVSFGIYVSQHATPLIKFIELLAASFAVALLGQWLEGKYQQFGRAVFAGGVTLFFFTLFAGYAVPPVKVIHNATVATALQFAAVGVIVICSLWKKSTLIASMSIFLGYVACFFSFSVGLSNASLVAGLVLASGAAYFYLKKQWNTPLQLSAPLTYLLFAGVAFFVWFRSPEPPAFTASLGYLLAYLAVFWAADYAALVRNTLMEPIPRRFVQLCSTSAAVLLGFWVTYELYADRLSTFYFLFGAAMLAFCVLYYLARRPDLLMQTYFAKGSTLLTFGIITEFGTRTRWATLAIQSLLLLLSAKRSRLRIVEVGSVLVWIVSFGFFVHFTYQMGYLANPHGFWTANGLASVVYLIFSACLLSLRSRWLGVSQAGVGPDQLLQGQAQVALAFRTGLDVILALLLGAAGIIAATAYFAPTYLPFGAAVLAVTVGLVGLVLRHWTGYLAGGIIFFSAHFRLWTFPIPEHSLASLWSNVFFLVLVTILLAICVFHAGKRRKSPVTSIDLVADGLLHGLWILALVVAYYKTFSIEQYFLLAVVTSILIAVVAERYPFHVLRDFSVLPMFLAFLGFVFTLLESTVRIPESGHSISLWIAAFAAFGLACRYASSDISADQFRIFRIPGMYQWALTLFAVLIGWYTLASVFDNEGFMVAVAVAGVVVGLLARWPGLGPALSAGVFYLFLGHIRFYWMIMSGPTAAGGGSASRSSLFTFMSGWSTDLGFLWASLAVAIFTMLYGVLVFRLRKDLAPKTKEPVQSLLGTLTLLLLYILFLSRGDALRNYVTAFWGISAVGVFLVGLADRSRPLRILGLLGLAVCIPRVFLVDIRSPLYRIFATGALAVVISLIAFLYNKYRDVIQRFDEDRTEP